MASVKPVCVLRSGNEYGPEHVRWLANQIPGLVCLGDVDVPGVPTIPLKYNWPGWWAKIELFRPDIAGDWLYFDLDTVITGPIDSLLAVGKTTLLNDFYQPSLPGSGVMYIAQGDKEKVWHAWIKSPNQHMQRCVTRQHWGDQGFLRDVLLAQRWQSVIPDKLISYKVHCRHGLPPAASVVCFHGNPRPWSSGAPWVPPLQVQ